MLKLEQFEGPFDLLLALIERQKLDITRLSLAQIAEEYLATMAEGSGASLAQMGDFLSIASRLLLLKSKSLLPFLILEAEEEEAVEDLEHRLQEYKKCKDAAVHFKALWESPDRSFSREKPALVEMSFAPPKTLTPETLRQAFARVVAAITVPETLERETVEEVVSIEERIIALRSWFADRIEVSFAETVAESEDRMEVIVSFLAMLELVKQKILRADQEGLFVEIRLRQRVIDEPVSGKEDVLH